MRRQIFLRLRQTQLTLETRNHAFQELAEFAQRASLEAHGHGADRKSQTTVTAEVESANRGLSDTVGLAHTPTLLRLRLNTIAISRRRKELSVALLVEADENSVSDH